MKTWLLIVVGIIIFSVYYCIKLFKLKVNQRQFQKKVNSPPSSLTNDAAFELLSQMPTAIAVFDLNMQYLVTTQKWLNDYNLQGQKVIGKSHYEVFPEISEEWKKIHKDCLNGAINKQEEAPFYRADGTLQWISWEVKPWYNQHHEIGGIIMFTNEVTEQRRISIESNKLNDILEKISQTARIGAWEVNLQNNYIYWSNMTRQIHEVADNYQPKLDNAMAFYKEGVSRDTIVNSVEIAIEQGIPFDVEVELITAKNKTVWVRAVGNAEFVDEKCTRLFGVFQDIHQTKTQELQISQLLAEQNAIFSSASEVAIITLSQDMVIRHFNKGAENLLGYSSNEIVDQATPFIFIKNEKLLQVKNELNLLLSTELDELDVLPTIAQRRIFSNQEWVFITKDNREIPVQLSITQMQGAGHEAIGYLVTAIDLSQIKQMQERLVESNDNLNTLIKTLSKQNWQLSNFAHVVSHNLRSPVANLILIQSLLTQSEDEDEKQLLLENLETIVGHLSETLNTLTDTIKIQESAKDDLVMVLFEEVLQKTKEILSGQIMDNDFKITYNFEMASSVSYKLDFMESIFLNLISNALKYKSLQKKPCIHIESSVSESGHTLLRFQDNGLGIDLEKYGSKVFGLNKTFHKHPEAKGIGLFIIKNQIESLGGSISVESEVGQGTIFTITF
ncbi:MAG: PAS domain-containing sensor histidine kinase [Flectobacillus sp.]|uniref:PAS domain-containing sensor histidine kinase n=1 Tax=Flectobacillus sp. TaxID=50419 RepID=UPI003B9AF522